MSNAAAVKEATGDQVMVQQYLEMAVKTANDQGMSTSELLGIFYYYTHSIAESYREEALKASQAAD